MSNKTDNPFHQWIRLEQPRLGCRAVFSTDDFFAAKERLIDPADPVFIDGKYDDHGKWMDGWESRRRRDGGYDHCIVRLGTAGIVRGVDIDTRFFTGNYPPAASIDACVCDADVPGDDVEWQEMLGRTDLDGDAHNFRPVEFATAVTHLRLNIFPDGGVARLRVYGEVRPDLGSIPGGDSIDLAAFENGGRALACSDEHYGSMHNLNMPGPGINMGDGWETARRRGPGNDWVIIALGGAGRIEQVALDTAFFKGNFPDRATIRAAHVAVPDNLESSSSDWPVLLPETKLAADTAHEFGDELNDVGAVTHIRLDIFPDGGVSRLRVFGALDKEGSK